MGRELQLEVICGTYEEFVVGYQLFKYFGDEEKHHFEQTFADHSHTASIRAVACHNDLLASGGADEVVKLYNMKRRTEMGQLMDHQGTVTCVEFHGGHHLLTGSEDGRVAVVRVDNWQCEKYLGRHKGGVTDLAVHPSGRIALTVGRDRKLITWDLVRGRVAFRTNLHAAGEFVLWSPEGTTYAVGAHGRCDVYSAASAGVLHSLKTSAKINCAAYVSESLLFCGDESGQATIFHVSGPEGGRGVSWQAHQTRLRSAAAVQRSAQLAWLVTASSDGWVRVWETPADSISEEPRLVAGYDTTCRLTCVTVHTPPDKRWPPPAEEEDVPRSSEPASHRKPAVPAGGEESTAGGSECGEDDGGGVDEDRDVGEESVEGEGEDASEESEPAPTPTRRKTKRKRPGSSESRITTGKAKKLKKNKKAVSVGKGHENNAEVKRVAGSAGKISASEKKKTLKKKRKAMSPKSKSTIGGALKTTATSALSAQKKKSKRKKPRKAA